MQSPMASANVVIIDELKKFIQKAGTEMSEKSKYVMDAEKDFIRNRTLTFNVLALMILNMPKRSLSIEIHEFFKQVMQDAGCTKQAFSKQRGKLKPVFFHDCNKVLRDSFSRHYGENVKLWKNKSLVAVDGSTVPLPQTDDLMQTFGGATNQSVDKPISVTARVCVIYDVLNCLTVTGKLHSYNSSEKDACMDCINDMESVDFEDKIFILDRGYSCFWMMYKFNSKGIKYLMRVKQNENNTVKRFMKSKKNDIITEWNPGDRSIKKLRKNGVDINKKTSIKVRMVKVMLNTGETEVLVTNLYDQKTYSINDLYEVYGLRWGIETGYFYIKEELQFGLFSGIRRICIEQDFAATLLMYNLQSLIEKQCEPYIQAVNRKRQHNYKVNKNVSWGMLKHNVVRLFIRTNYRRILTKLENLFETHLEPVRPNRKYPRIKRRRPNCKNYTLTNYKRAL